MHRAKFSQGQQPPKMYIQPTSAGDGQTSCKACLASGERRRCSNEAKTQIPLKFAGVPRTPEPISPASESKFAILLGHMDEILLFNIFFQLSIHALVAKVQPDKFVRWCADGDFLRNFCCLLYTSPSPRDS